MSAQPAACEIVWASCSRRCQRSWVRTALLAILCKAASTLLTEAAVVMMKPDGAVSALLGGIDYQASVFNRAVQAQRQPGSTFKPIVYADAIQNGRPPSYILDDSPLSYTQRPFVRDLQTKIGHADLAKTDKQFKSQRALMPGGTCQHAVSALPRLSLRSGTLRLCGLCRRAACDPGRQCARLRRPGRG